MQHTWRRIRWKSGLAFGCALLLCGCGKIPTWGELTGQAKPEPVAPPVQVVPPPRPVEKLPEPPPPPDPVATIQRFQTLAPSAITDADLALLGELTTGLDQITEIDAHGSRISGSGLAVLEKLPQLKTLNLDGVGIDGTEAAMLAKATALESVSLNGSQITDEQIFALRPLQNLVELRISNARLTPAGYAEIAAHKTLERLTIDSTPLDDNALETLCQIKNLKYLQMRHAQVSDQGLLALAELNGLVSLELGGCHNVHGETLSKLSKSRGMSGLLHLSLTNCALNERGAKGVNDFDKLEYLSIGFMGANDVHLNAMINGLSKLKHLAMGNNGQVTNAILKTVGKLKDLEYLVIENQSGIGDGGLVSLKPLKKLKRIYSAGTSITPVGLAQLQGFCRELDLDSGEPPPDPFNVRKLGESLVQQGTRPSSSSSRVPPTRPEGKPSGFVPSN